MKPSQSLSPIDRLEMRMSILEDGTREMRGDIRHLVEAWEKFVPAVADKVTKEVLIPGIVTGLMNSLRVPVTLEDRLPDPLDLRDFNFKKKEKD